MRAPKRTRLLNVLAKQTKWDRLDIERSLHDAIEHRAELAAELEGLRRKVIWSRQRSSEALRSGLMLSPEALLATGDFVTFLMAEEGRLGEEISAVEENIRTLTTDILVSRKREQRYLELSAKTVRDIALRQEQKARDEIEDIGAGFARR